MQRILLYFAFFCIFITTQAQTDTEFWFAAPDISWVHGKANNGDGRPFYLHMSAVHNTTITISRPSDAGFTDITVPLMEGESYSLRLDNLLPNLWDDIEVFGDGTIQQKGFKITATPGEITAFYELNSRFNRDIFPLKGRNALGTEFTVTTQNIYDNDPGYGDAKSGFVVVATQPNTIVQVDLGTVDYENHPGGGIVSITLPNPGDAYNFRVVSPYAANHPQGVNVKVLNSSPGNEKPIAITVYDDSMKRNNQYGQGGCRDTYGDQIVPDALLGFEYIVMKGNLGDPNPPVPAPNVGCNGGGLCRTEFVFITAIFDNTDIFIDGTYEATIHKGGVYPYSIFNKYTYIRTTSPSSVTHITGTGGGCEQGGAILPTIDGCTGSHNVTFAHSVPTSDDYQLNIMVRTDPANRTDAVKHFNLRVNGSNHKIPENYFEYSADSAFAFLIDDIKTTKTVYNWINNRIPSASPPTVATISNPEARFHLGVLHGGRSNGAKYGYFSDYARNTYSAGIGGAYADQYNLYCNLDPFQVVAKGGLEYTWSCEDMVTKQDLTHKISDIKAEAPYFDPDTAGFYEFTVNLTGDCNTDTNIVLEVNVFIGPTSNFELSDVEGCSPFQPSIKNTTDTTYAETMRWVFSSPSGAVDVNDKDLSNPFTRTFVNNTDTVQTHSIELISKGPKNTCPSILTRTIKVKPNVKAEFSPSDSSGCHPFQLTFDNKSTGHLDSTSYFWDFGDFSQSVDSLPAHTYYNYNSKVQTYPVSLIVKSPLNCTDTARGNIKVYPRVNSQFSLDVSNGCSPFTFNMNPAGSYGLDTLVWVIQDDTKNTVVKRTTLSTLTYTHRDTTYLNGPDTLQVRLIGINKYNCPDSAIKDTVIVYPEIKALLSVDKDVVCDSVPVNFSNLSEGDSLKFEWDFGDYTYKQDSTWGSHRKIYLNRTDSSKQFKTTLKAISEFQCVSFHDTTVTVHPYLDAGFGLTYVNNCSPLDVTFNNTSTRVSNYRWIMDNHTFYYDTNQFSYRFENPHLSTDTTFIIKLIGSNPEGCSDTTTRSVLLYQPVVAGFTMDTNNGCAPFNVEFTNKSSGASLYTWDFGDGISSNNTDTIFSKKFENFSDLDTIYTISLRAKNMAGCDSVVSKNITAFAYIDANFSLPVVDSCSPLTLRLKNLSSPGSKNIEWDFGNGDTSNDFTPNPQPTYTNTGIGPFTREITLRTYGSNPACADIHKKTITIFPELHATFDVENTVSCQPLISGIQNNSVPKADSGSAFTWNLNSSFHSALSAPQDLNIPNYTDKDSTHTLWLYGVTKYGCRDTASMNLTVHSLVDAYFTVDRPAICSGDSFLVDRSGSQGGITKYDWNFNNESSDTTHASSFYVQYKNTSNVNVKKSVALRVENHAGCDSSWTESVLVYPEVIADFEIDDSTVCYPHITKFSNTSTHGSAFYWDFGDKTGSTDPEPTHKYTNLSHTNDNRHEVRLIVQSSALCLDSIKKHITVYAKPKANYVPDVSTACPPFTTQLNNHSEGSKLIYDWNFADEHSDDEKDGVYTFFNDSTVILDKPVTLIVASDKECKDTITKVLNVYPDPKVSFDASITEGCSPLNIDFTENVKNVLQMEWLIDNTISFSTTTSPSERFENELPDNKQHQIKLIGTSLHQCTDSAEITITIWPQPNANFIAEPYPTDYNTELDYTTIDFHNETVFQDNWDYKWTYNDVNDSINFDTRKINSFSYGYMDWGDINNLNQIPVQLIAYNKNNPECNDTANTNIIINPPVPLVDLGKDIEGCVPFTVNFSAETKYIYEDQYEWDFEVTGATSANPAPTFTYTEPGTYTAKLTIYGDGGTNWDYKHITVHRKPEADFTFSDTLVFDSSQTKGYDWINFYNHTKFGSKYRWYFDSEDLFEDGYFYSDTIEADSYIKEPRWAYDDLGEYYVTLIAETSKGCFDTLKNKTTPIRVVGEGGIKFPTGFFVNPSTAPSDEYRTDQRSGNLYLFYPTNIGVASYKLEVYDKWGVLVFETNDVNQGWNGYVDGIPAKQGVYVWRAKGKYTNGRVFNLGGDVTLIRTEVNIDTQR